MLQINASSCKKRKTSQARSHSNGHKPTKVVVGLNPKQLGRSKQARTLKLALWILYMWHHTTLLRAAAVMSKMDDLGRANELPTPTKPPGRVFYFFNKCFFSLGGLVPTRELCVARKKWFLCVLPEKRLQENEQNKKNIYWDVCDARRNKLIRKTSLTLQWSWETDLRLHAKTLGNFVHRFACEPKVRALGNIYS